MRLSLPATTSLSESLLNMPAIARIRRNHGLEHATLHLLSQHHPKRGLAGHSDAGGFWILGDVSIDELQEAIEAALARLRNGERQLAVHPNCGTNLVTAGILAGVAAGVAMFGGRSFRDKVERLPLAASLATVALIVAQPLGSLLQEHVTTSGEPGNLRVVEIVASRRGRLRAYRVVTKE